MFSGYRTQGTVSGTKSLSRDQRPIFFYAVSVLRHFWTAHVNDRKRNQRIERGIQVHTLHSQATTGTLPDPSALAIDSKSNHPVLLLPWPRARERQPPSRRADSQRKFFNNEALKELQKDIYVDRIPHFLPEYSFNDEDLHKKAARTPRPAQILQWGKETEYRRFINRQLQDKSFLSYDWRVPLKLLKKYYRANSIGPQNQGDLITQTAAKAKPDSLTDTIHEPERWNKTTFDHYVCGLTSFRPPTPPVSRALELRRQRRGPLTVPEIGKTLHSLFHRREFGRFLEPKICNTAINFLTRHAMLSRARSLFFLMEHLSISIPVSTINIFLRAAAHQQDLHSFSWLLTIMIKRGFNPDAETWVIFVQCLDLIAVKRLVITEMATLGLLHKPGIRKRVIMATVKDDIIDFLASKREPRDFLYQMRLKHGPGWMSCWTGSIILNEVCKRVSLSAGLDLIEPMKRHGFSPDSVTLNIPFFQALTSFRGSLPLAAYILEIFARQHSVQPDRDAWEKLFQCAWKLCYLNVIRVIWISACLNGTVTYNMQQKVLYSLRLSALQYKPADYVPRQPTRLPRPRNQVFRSLMGKFVIGLDPLKYASWAEGQRAVMDCLRIAKTAKLRFTLSFNLREAYKVDREWRIEEGMDVGKKLEHRYPVLLNTDRSEPDR